MYIIANGIAFLPPGHRIDFSLNSYIELPKDEVSVEVSYFADATLGRRSSRSQRFTLRPLEFEGFGEWQDREREAHIATKKGMDSIRKTMDALRYGRVKLTVRPEIPPRGGDRMDWLSDEELTEAADFGPTTALGGETADDGGEDVGASQSS